MVRIRPATRMNASGFNMIELMVVIVIVGLLAAIAVPIYAKYARNARLAEATGRIGDLLTAAKTYAVANEDNGDPADAVWPENCDAEGFIGDCSETKNFTYEIGGTRNGRIKIHAQGRPSTRAADLSVILEMSSPLDKPTMTVTGF